MTLLAEDLLLLLLDDETGAPLVDGTRMPRVLAGAVLLELALSDVVTPAEDGEDVKKGRLVVRRDPPDDDVLADAVTTIRERTPMKPRPAIERLAKNLQPTILERLVDAGWVREERSRVLGVFPRTRWPEVDGTHERELRTELRAALIDGLDPRERTAALVALLSAVGAAPKVFPDADKKALERRAKEIAQGNWAGEAVRKAVEAIDAAVLVAVVVPV
ncbi:GPP34 family phosphoprotein [Rhodococcus rhodnii]|uniref:GPP34 family phosphoprotein n=2 Tax=Rhodococcus rhodnii TaxID=38312 RepID=R7WUM0_9NOCA|nr:GPP34 family phosphoprotein [Rhodococcus rhodnii]EOM77819.1 hypothetical protein Rrhod_0805 [Rhodococcus rhodnii LMG 5362]TXG88989.1 GPP34 family phosphoprotein [Rhodococcus rhodnii]